MADRAGATHQPTPQVEPDFAARQSVLWAIAWLVGGVTVTLLAQLVLLHPSLVDTIGFLSYPKLRAIADATIVFGWLATAGFAAMYALVPRITEVQLHNELLGSATTLVWGTVVTGGILGVVLGVNQGRPLAELGWVADLGMTLMLVAVLFNVGVTVVQRREKTLYASGWFLLSAALLAPIVYLIGNLPVFTGAVEAITSGYYLNGIEMLWMLPIGLGVAHYVIPVETGKALYSGQLARITFWGLVIVGGWAGQRFYLKGPAPTFLDAFAVAMSVALLIPVLTAATNLYATGRERWDRISSSFGLRWAAAGLGYAVAWVMLNVLSTVPSVNRFIGVSAWQAGVRHLAFFGVFSAFAFAFISHAYPLMVGRDWYSRTVSSFHFWTTNAGVIVGTALLLATGAAQASGTPAADAPSFIGVLRILTVFAFAAVVVAQYALVFNTFKTSRSGPFIHASAVPSAVGAR